jgi:lysophospholipase L1-like esterase
MRTIRLLAGVLTLCSFAFAQEAFHLKDGDRVVFYGDSITDQRLYSTFTESYVVTRFPKLDVTFVHSGWGGDRVTGGGGGDIDTRIQRDVLPYKPTVVTIMLGMNDGSYKPFDQEIFQKFATGYEDIVRKLKGAVPGVRITAIRPSPYDDVTREPMFAGGYNSVLVRYGAFIKELAGRERTGIADLNTAVVASLKTAYAADPEGAKRLIPDRVHPGPAGHLLMAAELLKSWGAPSLVTSVAIDAARPVVTESANTAVTDLRIPAAGSLAWTQLDGALPMPINIKDAGITLALSSSEFLEKLDRQPLKVTGLPAGRYELRIDSEPARVLSCMRHLAIKNKP